MAWCLPSPMLRGFTALDYSSRLLTRRVGRPDVRMAQILQHGLFVVAHTAREVWIVEPLIPRGLRHILQNAKLLLYNLPAVPGHLLPTREHIILDVVTLLRSEISPSIFVFAQLGLLLRGHMIPLIKLLPNLVLLVDG